jgi:hypothetical protein
MSPASKARARAKTSKRRKASQTRSTATPVLAAKLATALYALARGLPNPASGSDDFFRPFVAAMSPETQLDPGAFQRALKIGSRYHVDLSAADALLSGAEDPENWGEEIAGGFRLLERVMRATLSELSVAHARGEGVVRVRMWLFGRSAEGTLIGLRSTSTET